ncbi:MAG: glycosyltransferase family 4 protein [Elusimicrobia bacterium]|nr:glycosyltransferase family 4 protein [Elusimicrobiota bacterium]
MRIAQVAPLIESVPPRAYGGTERVVSYLTEELVCLGHDVTLFASSDSRTSARLIPGCDGSLRLKDQGRGELAHHLLLLEKVSKHRRDFDIVHFHVDYLHFPMTRLMGVPSLTTLHGRLDGPELAPIYREYLDMPLVSISDAQRAPLPFANWEGTVYHGLPERLLEPDGRVEDYLAFLGRISPEKRVDRAIEIARRAGRKIKIAAKIDPADRSYFEREIAGLMEHPHVEFLGEICEAEKARFLGRAYALLFPIDWPEPFGLAVIEAMACGTPVIAFNRGSVPEIVENGVTGWVVENIDEAAAALGKLETFDRRRCRDHFERRFPARRMAEDYLALYRRVLGSPQ